MSVVLHQKCKKYRHFPIFQWQRIFIAAKFIIFHDHMKKLLKCRYFPKFASLKHEMLLFIVFVSHSSNEETKLVRVDDCAADDFEIDEKVSVASNFI